MKITYKATTLLLLLSMGFLLQSCGIFHPSGPYRIMLSDYNLDNIESDSSISKIDFVLENNEKKEIEQLCGINEPLYMEFTHHTNRGSIYCKENESKNN